MSVMIVGPGIETWRGGPVRDDVVETSFEAMSPELQALIAYHPNGALDVEQPQLAIDEIRRTMPVVRWEMGVGFFVMDDVVAAGRNPHIVSFNPQTGEGFGMGSAEPLIPLHLEGDVHRHYRKLLDPLFTPKKMAALEPDIRKLADELIDGFIGDGFVEFHDTFCVPLPSTIFLRMFGLPLEDAPFLINMKDRILKSDAADREEAEVIGRAAGTELREQLHARLAERRREQTRRDDLLDEFMHFEVDGHSLDDDEVVNIMHMFTIAGLDTVTSSLSCMVAWLATHPDDRRRVVGDPEALARAIEELLRFESPVPSSGVRYATEDTEVNGVPVPAGSMVYLCWASANLDPATFDGPLAADLDRVDNRHIAFAAGTHRCLGSHLARMEMRAAIDQLHRRIPDYWVTEGEQIAYELAGVRQAKYLPLSFAPA
jgi:cytochrome P450